MTEQEKRKEAFKHLRLIVEADPVFNDLSDYMDNDVSLGETAGAVNPLLAWHTDIKRKIVPIREGQSRGGIGRTRLYHERDNWLRSEDEALHMRRPCLSKSGRAKELEKRCRRKVKQSKADFENGRIDRAEHEKNILLYSLRWRRIANILSQKK